MPPNPVNTEQPQAASSLQSSNAEHVKRDYMQYVTKATTLIHGAGTREAILKMLPGQDPVANAARAVVMVMQRLDVAIRQSGMEILDTIKMFGAGQIVEQVVELGNAAKVLDMDKDLALLTLSVASQDYVNGEVSAKRINRQKFNLRLQADLRQMPEKVRKQIGDSMKKVKGIAKKYNGGRSGYGLR